MPRTKKSSLYAAFVGVSDSGIARTGAKENTLPRLTGKNSVGTAFEPASCAALSNPTSAARARELARRAVEVVLDLALFVRGEVGPHVVQHRGDGEIGVDGFRVAAIDHPAEGALQHVAHLSRLQGEHLLRDVLGLEICFAGRTRSATPCRRPCRRTHPWSSVFASSSKVLVLSMIFLRISVACDSLVFTRMRLSLDLHESRLVRLAVLAHLLGRESCVKGKETKEKLRSVLRHALDELRSPSIPSFTPLTMSETKMLGEQVFTR